MNALTAFQFEETPVRVVMIAEEPWFIAADVGKALSYAHVPHMIRLLDDDEKGVHKVDTLGGEQEMTIISESGLYHAALKRRGQHAVRFRRWVTQEVLPSIRKTGRYVLHEPPNPSAPLLAMDNAYITSRVGLLREARRLYGIHTARELWVQLGLPVAIVDARGGDPIAPALLEFLKGRTAIRADEAVHAVFGRYTASGYERILKLLHGLGWEHRVVVTEGRGKHTLWFAPLAAVAEDAA